MSSPTPVATPTPQPGAGSRHTASPRPDAGSRARGGLARAALDRVRGLWRTDDPWQRWGTFIAAAFLVFLVFPAQGVLASDASAGVKVLGIGLVLGFAVLYLVGYTELRPLLVLGGLVVLGLAMVPILGVGALGVTPYVATHCALQLPRPQHVAATLVAALSPLAMLLHPTTDQGAWFALISLPVGLGMLAVRQMIHRGTELHEVETAYAVTAERERVARDVHDVLGHSLTAIVLKADLAERLVGRDDDRARQEVREVAELARQALTEARSTVVGIRSPHLEAELERAAELARSAGLRWVVQGQADQVAPRHRIVTAWVLREAVTNVVRHAGAEQITVDLGADRLEVVDDGRGVPAEVTAGSGMSGIRDRADSIGATVAWTDAGPGTRLTLTYPEVTR